MEQKIKENSKVIIASAGTGKTYRLSLEFISLLLKYQEIKDVDFMIYFVACFNLDSTISFDESSLKLGHHR